MQFSTKLRTLVFALGTTFLGVACADGGDDGGPPATASLSGVIKGPTGAVVQGATVKIGSATATTSASGQYELQNLPVGNVMMTTSADGFDPTSESLNLVAGTNARDVILTPIDLGVWGSAAQLLENNSEFALAEAGGKLYVLGGYPPQMGPNNHGMAASVNGKIYLLGGQTTDDQNGATAVTTVYEFDPARGTWVEKAPMPTARSGGVAVALGSKIYVAGGRVPRGNDFAAYDAVANTWEVLPDLPSQRNHFTGAAINGRVHFVGGRLGNGLSPLKTTAHEVFDPLTKTWTSAAPMLSGRSGINGVMARGCFHVWGGEGPSGMSPQHEYYDPRTDKWASLKNMPLPVHGVVGAAFVNDLIWVTGGGTNIGGGFGSLHNQTYKPAVSCL